MASEERAALIAVAPDTVDLLADAIVDAQMRMFNPSEAERLADVALQLSHFAETGESLAVAVEQSK